MAEHLRGSTTLLASLERPPPRPNLGAPSGKTTLPPDRRVQERRVGLRARPRASRDRGQRLVVDDQPLGGVFGDVAVRGDHRGDRLADEAHAVHREQGMVGLEALYLVAHAQRARERRSFAAGEYLYYARVGPRGVRLHAPHVSVGVRAADEGQRQGPRRLQIVHEPRPPREKPRIFDASHPRAHPARALLDAYAIHRPLL